MSIDNFKVSVVCYGGVRHIESLHGYSKMTEKPAGTSTWCLSYGGVSLIEVSVKRELTAVSLDEGIVNIFVFHAI